METNKINKITILSIVNTFILSYTAWVKYSLKGCPLCTYVPFLPINGVTVALVGIGASLTLAVLGYVYSNISISKYIAFIFATLCASFASFLQVAQFYGAKNFCYLCLTAAIIFYAIFAILFYEVIFKTVWLKMNPSMD